MKKITFLLSLCIILTSCISSPAQISNAKSGTSISVTHIPISTETAINIPTSVESAIPAQTEELSECLSPIKTFEYQTGDAPNDIGFSVFNEKVLPPQEWQKTTSISDASRLMLVQSRNNETIFWIGIHNGGFVRYRILGDKWTEGTLLPGPADDLGGFPLFLDQENNVFGARHNKLDQGNTGALLNRYNDQTNQWESVSIDLANQDELAISHAEVDEHGIFWLLVKDGDEHHLYSFDPSTKTTKRHLADYVLYPHNTSFRIWNRTIFILAEKFVQSNNGDPVLRYILIQYPLDGGDVKFKFIGQPIYNNYQRTDYDYLPDNIFVDTQQRVWVGGRGWLDLQTDEWHYVIPAPVFITVLAGAGQWKWGEPEITAETPDGRLWYNALRGTGWLDPKLGKWCVFTSYQSNVLPDSHDNLWLVANDWLYKHK